MILYKEDWKYYPGAIIHVNTKNKTFLRFAGLLKKMGIENNSFCLALHDSTLEFVDPFDYENLTDDLIKRIMNEARVNPWYVFRELLRIPAKGVPKELSPRFMANRGNIALYWLFFNHIDTFLVQIRQTGKSVAGDSLILAIMIFLKTNDEIIMLTKDDKTRRSNVKRIKDMRNLLPVYLQFKTKKDTDNFNDIYVAARDMKYTTNVPQNSAENAASVGRGFTASVFQIDEIAYVKYIKETLGSMLAAGGAARDIAKDMGTFYGSLFTTTAGRLHSDSGKYSYQKYLEGAVWTEHFYDVNNIDELRKIVRKNSKGKRLAVTLDFNHRQIGKTDQWLRDKIAEANSEGEDLEADFFNKWVKGKEGSIWTKDEIFRIDKAHRDPVYSDIDSNYGYITRWYIPGEEIENYKNRSLVLALDTSDAVGADDIALTLKDITNGEVIAAGDYNETNLITFAEWLFNKWVMKFSKTLIMIERKSSGVAIIDYLIKFMVANDVNPFQRLFNWVVNDKVEKKERYEDMLYCVQNNIPEVYVKYRKFFGFATSGVGRTARDFLYGTCLKSAFKYSIDKLNDSVLANQLMKLVDKNGRIDHTLKNNDDLCISWLLSHYVLIKGNNLEYYNIKPSQVLYNTYDTTGKNIKNDEETIKEHLIEQKILKDQINFLIENLRNNRNKILVHKIIAKIKMLHSELDSSGIEALNINTRLEEIEELKQLGIVVDKI